MIKFTGKSMEKIMRRIVAVTIWSISFMIFNSCMPIDISEPPSYTENNLAPIIVSTTPRSLHSPYYLSEFQTFDIRVIDLNENDELTVAWYVKDVSSEGKLVPLNGLTYKRPATNDYTIDEAKFSITLKESTGLNNDGDLNCGLNRLIVLVSDRGLRATPDYSNGENPYPTEAKVDIREWILRRTGEGCPIE